MKNKLIVIIVILFCICIICEEIFLLNRNGKEEQNKIDNLIENTTTNTNQENYINTNNIEGENKLISDIQVIINGKKYNAKIEENQTAQSFVKMLPVEYNMSELNGNEKYVYLDNTLTTNSYGPKHIEAGDIMLYGNNCLVVFYKSFETSYSYTKIGHIENLFDLGNGNIVIKFEK